MIIVLGFLRSIFFIAIGLYIYFITRRKQHDVVIQMWVTIIVGMLANLAIQIIDLKLGISKWESVQISIFLLTAIVVYSLWKLSIELRKRHSK
ncbi:hypothetical protein [Desulfosporosinus lacus]|uniref:Uncharacterized protein n=1 Tax=Desulfosporosinus lacus DSM 15449 TaxID=1121420 RepID=A0A1M5W931_9FIRM|nr:hypothetical protein [Desulfosporosinus lacus]SHH83703.1 hypothetical protein SAMN02746098_01496 [Desulfosporosinus lacus DSM 15449]